MSRFRSKVLRKISAVVACALAVVFCACTFAAAQERRLRCESLAIDASGKFLLVANRDAGTIGVIDLASKRATGEHASFHFELALAGEPCFIRRLGDSDRFLVCDYSAHELIAVAINDSGQLTVAERISVGGYPGQLSLSPGHDRCAVSCLWSRRMSVCEIQSGRLSAGQPIDLDFAPGPSIWLDDQFVLVADAFGSQAALIDCDSATTVHSWNRSGQRIAGMAMEEDQVLVSTIKLNPLAHTVNSDVHWGTLISNELHALDKSNLLSRGLKLKLARVADPLGGPGEGKGDPASVAITDNGLRLVLLQGVGQLAIGDRENSGFSYLNVGAKPTDMVVHEKQVYVCNSLDDSICCIDLETEQLIETLELNPELEDENQLRQGERLFFDSRLALDGWMSCHSCHVNGHTNGMLNDNKSDQSFGAAKLVISLAGNEGSLPLAWNGSFKSVEDQVRHSINSTMQGKSPDESDVRALAAFVRSLEAPPSLAKARDEFDQKEFDAGRQVFEAANCQRCHDGAALTSGQLFDVGSVDEIGRQTFNPPSLVGVSQRDRFFHDGRASSLRQVFDEQHHPDVEDHVDLDQNQIELLLKYLSGL